MISKNEYKITLKSLLKPIKIQTNNTEGFSNHMTV